MSDSGYTSGSSPSQFNRKKPYENIVIEDIHSSGKYVILCSIISISDNELEVTDDTATMKVILKSDIKAPKLEEGMQIRIFGFVDIEPKKVMNAMIIHDWTRIDFDLFRQMRELERSLENNA